MTAIYQLTLPLDPLPPSIAHDPAAFYDAPCPHRRVSELDRLRAELAALESRKQQLANRQRVIRSARSKLSVRQAALSAQIDSLERNPLSILRYQTSRVPEGQRGELWFYRPTSELRLESTARLGPAALTILLDRCPTIGDLEIMRVHEGLTRLPGIGDQKAARVEQRLLDWLAHNAFGYRPAASYESRVNRRESVLPREIVL